jgi:hypothetical protein
MKIKPFEEDTTAAGMAAKGSGKSVFLAYALACWDRGILVDMLGVFNPKSDYKTAIVPDSIYFKNPDSFISKFKDLKKYPEKKYIIDLSHYTKLELIEEADKLFGFLYKNNPYGKGHYPLLVDEIMDIANEQGKTSYELIRTFKNGRNFGIKPMVVMTQRPQNTDKTIYELADAYYISKQMGKNTLKYINDIVQEDISKQVKQIPKRHFIRYDGEIQLIEVPFYSYAFEQ